MKEEVLNEINRRYDILKQYAVPESIKYGTTGSRLKFHMALNLLGGKPTDMMDNPEWAWIDDKYIQPILTVDEYYSGEYDEFLDGLLEKLLLEVNSRSTN